MQASSQSAISAGHFETLDRPHRSPRERLRGLVADILARRSVTRPFSDDDTLAEVGLASLDMVTLMLAVENEFMTEIPQSEITADVFRSVSTLEDLILRLAPPAPRAGLA